MTEEERKYGYLERVGESNEIISHALNEVFKQPKLFESYLNVLSRFEYSACDSLIIAKKAPDATQFLTFKEWNNIGRRIKKAQKGLTFPELDNGKSVWFDISQTNSPIPVEEKKERTPQEKLRSLLSNNKARIITVSKPDRTHGKPAYFDTDLKVIFFDRNSSFESLYPALAKEIAHSYFCESLVDNYDRSEYETSAQMVSYIICKKNLMTPSTVSIPKEYKELSPDEVRKNLEDVRLISSKISDNIEYYYANGKDKFERPKLRRITTEKKTLDNPDIKSVKKRINNSKNKTSEEKNTHTSHKEIRMNKGGKI